VSLPCSPGCEDGRDLGVLRTDRPQGVSCQRLRLPVTWLSHQRPRRKGNSLFLKAWRRPCDSPSVFPRHLFEVWASRACPSLREPHLGVCFLLCPPISRSPGVLTMDGSPGPGDASGRMSAPAPRRAQIPRHTRCGAPALSCPCPEGQV